MSGVPNGSKITIRQVLGLTSGLGPLKQDFWRVLQEEPSRHWTPRETLGYMAAPYARPGEGFRYGTSTSTRAIATATLTTSSPAR